jgi:hypothetical protein
MASNQLSQLEAKILAMAKDVLKNEVKENIIDVLVENSQESIYDSYEPTEYSRRFSFLDRDKYEAEVIDEGLFVKPVQEPNTSYTGEAYDSSQNYFAQWIEFGNNSPYPVWPRDFIGETERQLESTDSHIKALKDGLRKRGLEVI